MSVALHPLLAVGGGRDDELRGARSARVAAVEHEDAVELHLAAEVGEDGRSKPISPDDPDAITSMVFREGRSIIASRRPFYTLLRLACYSKLCLMMIELRRNDFFSTISVYF